MTRYNLQKGFTALREERLRYVRPYTFNTPIVMSAETAGELKTLGVILHKTIRRVTDHYLDYLSIFPRSTRELEILKILEKYPYTVGSFRGDFVISRHGKVKVIELNARQPLNGYFETAYFYNLAAEQTRGLGIRGISGYYSRFNRYVLSRLADKKRVCVVYDSSKPGDRKFYPDLFRIAGSPCHLIKIADLRKKANLLKDALVICEFEFEEIFTLTDDEVELLARHDCLNYLRPALTSGSKLFFCMLTDEDFLKEVLNPKETALVKKYIVPTYTLHSDTPVWKDVRKNKNGYIIKHQNKGMSEDVYAGSTMSEREWKKLFSSGVLEDMVVQQFIFQKRIEGFVGTEPRGDYATGILLYWDNEFFGPGLYRTCDHPVFSNKHSFRKVASLVADRATVPSQVYCL